MRQCENVCVGMFCIMLTDTEASSHTLLLRCFLVQSDIHAAVVFIISTQGLQINLGGLGWEGQIEVISAVFIHEITV